MADLGPAPELDSFRSEARTWLEENFPARLRRHPDEAPTATDTLVQDVDYLAWRKRFGIKGWTAPTWPAEYGGGGLSPQQASVLQDEMDRLGAFTLLDPGIIMMGPTLLDLGTHDQKLRHLPPMIRGEVRWCYGLSEPGSGSDLASLTTRCLDAGDHWRIDGQKIWTSGAHLADWCGALVRTNTSTKHDGISFVMIKMDQPGVEVRPIKLIAGHSPFCETFFTAARTEKNDIVGDINRGWSVVKRLLQHERFAQTGAGEPATRPGAPTPLQELAKTYVGVDEAGNLADQELRTRVTQHLMDAQAHRLTVARAATEARGNAGPSNAVSILKNSATRIAQTRHELTLEVMGHQGLGVEGIDFTDDELTAVRDWLSGRALSILGGSFEIQYNIVAKRILGLPDATHST